MKKRKVKLFASIASLGLVVAVMGVGVWAATQQAVKVSSQVSFVATSVAADITLQVHNNTTLPNSSAKGVNDIVELASLADPAETGDKYKYYEAKALMDKDTLDGKQQYVARFVNDTAKTFYENRVYLKVADKDEDGYLNKGAEIVYEFKIKAHNTSAPIYYELTANLLHTQIPGTDYYLDDVFDVTVTDQYNDTITNTTYDEIGSEDDPLNQVMITNWTDGYDDATTADPNAIQPGVTTGDGKVTEDTPTDENLTYSYGEVRTIKVVYTVKDLGEDAEEEGDPFYGYQGISYTMTSLQLGDIYIKVANNGKNLDGLPNFGTEITGDNMDKKVDWTTDKKDNYDGIELTPTTQGD